MNAVIRVGAERRDALPDRLLGRRSQSKSTSAPRAAPHGFDPARRNSQREAHVSAKQAPSGQAPRLPPPHVRPRRPLHHQGPPPQGKAEAVRLIPAVRGRRAFDALRRHGTRARSGALRITFHADASPSPRLAFAIGRQVGQAVVRNRARRRLRVIFAQVAHTRPDLVPPGDYLVAVHRAEFSTEEAHAWLISALEQLRP